MLERLLRQKRKVGSELKADCLLFSPPILLQKYSGFTENENKEVSIEYWLWIVTKWDSMPKVAFFFGPVEKTAVCKHVLV